jgi:hypothetical protein
MMLNLNGQHAHGRSLKFCEMQFICQRPRSSRAALPWTGEMDANTTRDLALLAALSLFCAGFAWSWGYVILGWSFLRSV